MFNPFSESAEDDPGDTHLVEQAKKGNRSALEKLVLRHQAWIYNIAVRMVFQPEDAEEVTQEVLIKVITVGRQSPVSELLIGLLPSRTFVRIHTVVIQGICRLLGHA